jgi:Protein of unknown function (DUF2510)
MTTNAAPPGWHPDPSNPGGGLRWWDGMTWTQHTQRPPADVAAPYGSVAAMPTTAATPATAAPYGSDATTYAPAAAPYGSATAPANLSFATRNSLSLIAIGVVVIYILLAVTTHVILLGIFPVLMSVRATKRREALAPVAVIAALVAVGVAIITLT